MCSAVRSALERHLEDGLGTVASMEPAEAEMALLAEMTAAMAKPPDEPTIEAVEVTIERSFPTSELVTTFRCPTKGPALFGYRVAIWARDSPLDELGVEAFATSVWLDIHDSVMTDLGFPRETATDGPTWIRTDP